MKIIECPRDAMQGISQFIPTESKARYINQLLKVGFDTIDFGSFVSAKAIPQMKDTAEVLRLLDVGSTKTSLLAIVANERGARDAASFKEVSYLGFPLSISETFQIRNTNKSIPEALNTLAEIKEICMQHHKKLVTYISMGFGNPYGDPYEISMVAQFIDVLATLGTDVISLSDTIGAATPAQIREVVQPLAGKFSELEIGVHLHSAPDNAIEKIKAAYECGCRRFDGTLRGFGGCPMAKDDLVGNIATENILTYLKEVGEDPLINEEAFLEALNIAGEIFPKN